MNLINANVRRALAMFWNDRCTVYQQQKTTDPVTHLTDFSDVPILIDEPCFLSLGSMPAAQGDPVARVSQSAQLFLSHDVNIPAGCRIVVTRPNDTDREMVFTASGTPGYFHNHQVIDLVELERYA